MSELCIALADFQSQRDCDAFLFLLDHYSRDAFGGGVPLDADILNRLPEAWSDHPGTFSMIAWKSETPVGLVNCVTSFSTFRAKPRINIHDLVVHADQRGEGLGRKLIEAVVEQARARDACQVTLEVRADNQRARELYQRCGFAGIELPAESNSYLFGVLKLEG